MHARGSLAMYVLAAIVAVNGCGSATSTAHSVAPTPTAKPSTGVTATIVNQSNIDISVKVLGYVEGKGAALSFSAPCVDVDAGETDDLYADPESGTYALVMSGYACFDRTLGSVAYASATSGEQLVVQYAKGPLVDLGTFVFNGSTLRQQAAAPSRAAPTATVPTATVPSGTPSPGEVVTWSSGDGFDRIPGGAGLTAIAANLYTEVALKEDGTVVAWGQARAVPLGLSDVLSIAAGAGFALAVRSDGTVVAWGDESRFGEQQLPPGLSDVRQVAAGFGFGIALKNDGTVVGWGTGYHGMDYGQATAAENVRDAIAISAFGEHCLALKSDGTVVGWGPGSRWASGEGDPTEIPEGLREVKAIAAGHGFSVALKSDGTVVAWGDNTYGESTVPGGLRDVVAIAGGPEFAAALRSDGTVVVWGTMGVYQPSPAPAAVPHDLPRLTAIAASGHGYLGLVK